MAKISAAFRISNAQQSVLRVSCGNYSLRSHVRTQHPVELKVKLLFQDNLAHIEQSTCKMLVLTWGKRKSQVLRTTSTKDASAVCATRPSQWVFCFRNKSSGMKNEEGRLVGEIYALGQYKLHCATRHRDIAGAHH